ncbi:MAG: metal-dependent phosphohydrolase [Planctomycetes bacterium]|nr:metal-dependent phosphohydrolase [Planctomycetota bacterium]
MDLFSATCRIVRTLKEAGHDTWIVGGSVRDRLLGVPVDEIEEFDVATAAHPAQVEATFERTHAAGKAFGVIRVGVGPHWLEVATFRTEEGYSDGRRPDKVEFATAEEDVHRRDFTVNGLLWNPDTDEIRDYVGGRADLDARRIRAIGDAEERIREDGLRLLRAVRFGAWHDFELEPATLDAVRHHRACLANVSEERLRDELLKMATRPSMRHGDAWRLLVETGLAPILLQVDPDAAQVADDVRVIAALTHRGLASWLAAATRRACPAGSPPAAWRSYAERLTQRLRLSTDEHRALADLLADRARYRDLDPARPVRLRLAATRPDAARHEDLLAAEGDAVRILDILRANRETHGSERPIPLLDGRRLMAAGLKPGRGLGRALRRLRVRQLSGALTTSEQALTWLGLAASDD